ncbi:MAG: hypothetical protein GY715_02915 [Planctomycetes bacterium]|nr:hypothetical protein [Planctomycetota bacterium]
MNPTRVPTRRRWPRVLLIVVAAIILIVVVRWTYRIVTATPAPVIDYAAKMRQIAADHQPEGRDGWDLFVEAATITSFAVNEVNMELADAGLEREGVGPGLDLGAGLDGSPDLELLAPELRVLALLEERGAIELLEEAAACPRALRTIPSTSPMFNIMLPELAALRQLAEARAFSMRLAADDGDEAARLAAFEQTLALGRAPGSQAILIDRLVGMATVQFALAELRFELVEHPIDEATGRALLDAMDRQLPLPPVTVALEGEHCFALDMVQWGFSDDGHGDGRIDMEKLAQFGKQTGAPPPPGPSIFGRARSLIHAGRAETTQVIDEFYAGIAELAEMTPADRRVAAFDPNTFVAQLGYRHWMAKVFLPAIGKVVDMDDVLDVQVLVTRTLIALEMYRHRHGEVPATLDALVPEFLPEVPADPLHGGPLVYRLAADAPGGFELYSTGVDGVDDSSKAPPDARDAMRIQGDAFEDGRDFLPERRRKFVGPDR